MKNLIALTLLILTPVIVTSCTTNAATGRSQFTGLMPEAQEEQIGAAEHQKIAAQYGLYDDPKVNAYVESIGRKIAANTERDGVEYKFYVIDSPIVNAFALPGGYVYVSRGLLALANSEAEVAAVLGHEVGHITGRHTAERYSRAAVTSLGANILSAAIDNGAAAQALGVGANLYLSSYSRSQETESDSLGLRYMTRAGYAASEMPKFLSSLQAQSGLDARMNDKSEGFSYFSTHPATGDRVNQTYAQASQYPEGGTVGHDAHMRAIDGLPYSDSASQGFAKGNTFYHPEVGFAYDVPNGYRFVNQPNQVIALKKNGPTIIFDMAGNPGRLDAANYLKNVWTEGKTVSNIDSITINGMPAATGMITGTVNGKQSTIRLIAIEFERERFARFQIAIPSNTSAQEIENLKTASYSFRKLSSREQSSLRPHMIDIVTARSGDTIQSLAAKMPYDDYNVEQFRVLNALLPNEAIQAGRKYKVIR